MRGRDAGFMRSSLDHAVADLQLLLLSVRPLAPQMETEYGTPLKVRPSCNTGWTLVASERTEQQLAGAHCNRMPHPDAGQRVPCPAHSVPACRAPRRVPALTEEGGMSRE